MVIFGNNSVRSTWKKLMEQIKGSINEYIMLEFPIYSMR